MPKETTADDKIRNDRWKRMSELRDSIEKRTKQWDHIVNGKMLLGWTLKLDRLPK